MAARATPLTGEIAELIELAANFTDLSTIKQRELAESLAVSLQAQAAEIERLKAEREAEGRTR